MSGRQWMPTSRGEELRIYPTIQNNTIDEWRDPDFLLDIGSVEYEALQQTLATSRWSTRILLIEKTE